jgi:beta-mannan synthase
MEQTGRAAAYGCFGFNGTGGVWRREAIAAGGGWSWETVTEDLALSYKAFLKGYRFVYVRDIPQKLESPANILAHLQQKHRWTKVRTDGLFAFVCLVH